MNKNRAGALVFFVLVLSLVLLTSCPTAARLSSLQIAAINRTTLDALRFQLDSSGVAASSPAVWKAYALLFLNTGNERRRLALAHLIGLKDVANRASAMSEFQSLDEELLRDGARTTVGLWARSDWIAKRRVSGVSRVFSFADVSPRLGSELSAWGLERSNETISGIGALFGQLNKGFTANVLVVDVSFDFTAPEMSRTIFGGSVMLPSVTGPQKVVQQSGATACVTSEGDVTSIRVRDARLANVLTVYTADTSRAVRAVVKGNNFGLRVSQGCQERETRVQTMIVPGIETVGFLQGYGESDVLLGALDSSADRFGPAVFAGTGRKGQLSTFATMVDIAGDDPSCCIDLPPGFESHATNTIIPVRAFEVLVDQEGLVLFAQILSDDNGSSG